MTDLPSIKGYVCHRLTTGATPRQIWTEAQARFPHKCVSWSYITKIRRELLRTRPGLIAKLTTGKRDG